MLILSIDSASAGCGAAVWRDGKLLGQHYEFMERGQDRRLLPVILELMKSAAVSFDDLDRVAVTRGPGSFTGLRIGLAAARGIGLAAGKPVIGIDRFSVFRTQIATENKNLLIVLNSKRKELYCRFYPMGGDALPAVMWSEDEIVGFIKEHPATVTTGDAAIPGTDFLKPPLPEAVTVALLAATASTNDPAFLPRPLYLRAPDVTIPKPTAAA